MPTKQKTVKKQRGNLMETIHCMLYHKEKPLDY